MKKVLATTMDIGSITAAGAMNIDNRDSTVSADGTACCKNLRDITFENGRPELTEIGAEAFRCCYQALETIRIPANVEELGDKCFDGCDNLREVIFPEDSALLEIGEGAFSDCPLLKVIRIPATTIVADQGRDDLVIDRYQPKKQEKET
jgi:hypothetical protein